SANVILVGEKEKPRAVVTDFGLARGRSEDEWLSISVTGTDLVVGTAAYMAPEQAEGLEATHRSDVYSFGVVLFEMVTGDLPHAGATPMALLVNRLKAPPRSPRGLVKDLETKWEAAILRCLEIRPEDRFANPMEAIAVLDGTAPVPEIRAAGSGTFGRPEIAVRTLLVTEITGEKSLFSSSEGARATTLLDRHETLLSELRERHSGREVDRIAGTLILFPRPGDAVEFALAYHREMAALAEGTPLASRVAIHLGEAALQENSPDAVSSGAKALEVEGSARAAATRLLALASPKQTLLTRAAYDVARRALEGESTTGVDRRWMLHGAYRFEGSEEPVEIGEVGRPGDAPLSPPPDGPVARRVEAASSPRRMGWLLAAAAAALLLLAFVVSRRAQGPEGGAAAGNAVKVRRSVAVLGFKNLSSRPDVAWVSTALAEMLHGELSAGEALRTIPGENVARMKLELSLADTDSLAKDTLAKIRSNLGTDLVVLGSYLSLPSPNGNQLRLVVTLQDAASGETVATVNESGGEEGLIGLVADAGSRLRRQLGAADLSATEAGAAIASLPASPEALRLYAEGLARLHFLDAAAARDLLAKAAAVDPGHPLIHAALAEAWSALGYDKKAEDEAKKAHDVSSSLSREERFSVEARFLEMTRDFGKAIETYRALFGFFPDNVDYGLRLAAAETAAGRGKEALATIEKLRSLPAPASEDVRIDLAEATAANAQSDHKRAAKVAARAAEKGKAKGARILYGRALLEGAKAAVRLGETRQSARDCEEAQRIFAEAGDHVDEAAAVNRHADAFFEDGDLVEAKRLFFAALGLYRGIGNQKGTAIALNNVADTGKEMGELAEAEKLLVEAIAHVRETGDRNREGLYVSNLADVHLLLGNLTKAKMEYDEALAVNRETGYRYALNLNLVGLGLLSLTRGEPEKARPYLEECLDTCQKTGDRRLLGFALASLGDLSLAEGDVTTARARHEEALRERQKLGERRETAESRIGLARVALEEAHRDEAVKLASDAARDLVAQGLPDRAAIANALLGEAS
ncbi:MAG TPA: tetratricopeptide repeat protein, partial [Thermoanaerobaculia bacterium]|nr:tetratricopeptide repeat protein [Thermoanaerobaculia bacterium]